MRIILFCSAMFLAASAHAQQLADTYDNWRVLSIVKGGNQVCYIASLPVEQVGTYKKRGEPYLLVTHKSANVDEVSVSAGYPFNEKEDVKLSFGQKSYRLFAKGELAWAYDEASDKAIVKDMMRGNRVTIEGTSWKGTKSKDTYALKGFTAAHRKMKQLCK